MKKLFYFDTTCVTTAINKIEAVIEKNRDSLSDEDVQLLEECLVDLNSIKSLQAVPSLEQLIDVAKLIAKLFRFFNIDFDSDI